MPGMQADLRYSADHLGCALALGQAGQVSLAGHDIGDSVAYAYAAAHPDSVRRLTLVKAPLFEHLLPFLA